MYGAIHATTTQQAAVGRIDDGINLKSGNITGDDFNH
jgi:hypothetical protein